VSFYHNRSSKEPGEEMKKRQISNPKQQRIDFNHQDLEKMIVKKHKSKLAFFLSSSNPDPVWGLYGRDEKLWLP